MIITESARETSLRLSGYPWSKHTIEEDDVVLTYVTVSLCYNGICISTLMMMQWALQAQATKMLECEGNVKAVEWKAGFGDARMIQGDLTDESAPMNALGLRPSAPLIGGGGRNVTLLYDTSYFSGTAPAASQQMLQSGSLSCYFSPLLTYSYITPWASMSCELVLNRSQV